MKTLFFLMFLFVTVGVNAQDSSVLIGLNAPAYGIRIKTHFSGVGSWSRGYFIVNQDNTTNFFGFGVLGAYANDTTRALYGWIGQDYDRGYMYFLPNGNVGLGTKNPQNKLSVKGNIQAQEVKVTTAAADWPDYVFRPDYRLISLDSLSGQIKQLGHLPDIPSAKDIEKNGQALGEMNKKLLQKVEELTLYIVEQQKEIKYQGKLLEQQAAELDSIKQKISK